MTNPTNLFSKFCPPGSEPLEHWIERLLAHRRLSTTARALGLILAHRHACGGPNPATMIDGGFFFLAGQAGLDLKVKPIHERAWKSLCDLEEAGLVRRRVEEFQREGRPFSRLISVELLISRGTA